MRKFFELNRKLPILLILVTTVLTTLIACGGSSKSGGPDIFIGSWKKVNDPPESRSVLIIEKFGKNFTVRPKNFDDLYDEKKPASYNKESNKLVVPGELGSGTDIIYNSGSNTIIAWGDEYKKVEVNK